MRVRFYAINLFQETFMVPCLDLESNRQVGLLLLNDNF